MGNNYFMPLVTDVVLMTWIYIAVMIIDLAAEELDSVNDEDHWFR